jgi:hypothetical protein
MNKKMLFTALAGIAALAMLLPQPAEARRGRHHYSSGKHYNSGSHYRKPVHKRSYRSAYRHTRPTYRRHTYVYPQHRSYRYSDYNYRSSSYCRPTHRPSLSLGFGGSGLSVSIRTSDRGTWVSGYVDVGGSYHSGHYRR